MKESRLRHLLLRYVFPHTIRNPMTVNRHDAVVHNHIPHGTRLRAMLRFQHYQFTLAESFCNKLAELCRGINSLYVMYRQLGKFFAGVAEVFRRCIVELQELQRLFVDFHPKTMFHPQCTSHLPAGDFRNRRDR